jgi:hypothetical protein
MKIFTTKNTFKYFIPFIAYWTLFHIFGGTFGKDIIIGILGIILNICGWFEGRME